MHIRDLTSVLKDKQLAGTPASMMGDLYPQSLFYRLADGLGQVDVEVRCRRDHETTSQAYRM